ncbi:MAG: VanZ family protein [Bacilli bacterium]
MKEKSKNINYSLLISVFIIYMLLLIWVIVLKFNSIPNLESAHGWKDDPMSIRFNSTNLIPFYFIYTSFKSHTFPYQEILNIFIFIPFGICLSLLFKRKKVWLVILISFLLSTIFEVEQLITALGYCDINDVITNVLGACLGAIIPIIFKGEKSNKVTNILCIVFLVILTPILIYACVMTCKTWSLYEGLLW